jgi:hypothetical protein
MAHDAPASVLCSCLYLALNSLLISHRECHERVDDGVRISRTRRVEHANGWLARTRAASVRMGVAIAQCIDVDHREPEKMSAAVRDAYNFRKYKATRTWR